MAHAVTINRPEVVSMIEEAADMLIADNTTAVVGLAVRRLLDQEAGLESLFCAHPGSVRVRDGGDLLAPVLHVEPDAESGREIGR